MRQKRAAHTGHLDHLNLSGLWTLRAFDDRVAAPLQGLRDVADDWKHSASKPHLKDIAMPTLILHARNDPFMPSWAMARPEEVSPAVTLDYPEQGGHAGFLTGLYSGSLV